MSSLIDRYNSSRTPPRPPEMRVGDRVPPAGGGVLIAKFDGERTDKLYTGHLWNGSQGEAIQWLFPNDPGVDDIISSGEFVEVSEAPAWFVAANSSSYDTVASAGKRYIASAPIWGVLA